MLSFTAVDHDRIASGALTVTWRLWKYAHVKPGRVYASGFGGSIHVDDVRQVRAAGVTDADAHEAGLPDVASLFELVRSHTGAAISPDTVLYRVRFRYSPEPPPRDQVPLADIPKRLERLDARSPHGPWTLTALRLIEDNPGVAARHLAARAGRPTQEFKAAVRRLKALGLTVSLETGYELSELGQAYLDALANHDS